ncbi:hypothetical protein B0H14DRAFT_3502242 [Mycena olivaceomarginata]|nr:hypothetical protein B0H14DRAFT_3502242 [Mycena olivaceomarginata]
MTSPASPSSNLNPDSEDSELERQWDEYEIKLAAYKRHEARRVERLDARQKAEAVQTKRAQWKAASARYYERHPEVKEKKRIKAAEQRAAKKLARRRWDPPRRAPPSHPVPPAQLPPAQLPPAQLPPAQLTQTLAGYSDGPLPDVAIMSHSGDDDEDVSRFHCPESDPNADAMAAESLLDLHARPTARPTSVSGQTEADTWASIAPQYDSSDEE